MYVFVRFTGYVLVVTGVLLIVGSFVSAIYLLLQGDNFLKTINLYLLTTGGKSVFPQDSLTYFALMAVIFFLSGMLTAAFGQLMLVFADIGSNSRETNILLRSLRNRGQ